MNDELARMLLSFGTALLLTVVVEAPVAWLLGLRALHEQLTLLLINIITNPTLNLLLAALAYFGIYAIKSPFDPLMIALECVVVAAEALMLKFALGKPLGKAAAISLSANAASWLAGVLILWH